MNTSGQLRVPAVLPHWEGAPIQPNKKCVGPRVGLVFVGREDVSLPRIKPRLFGPPARCVVPILTSISVPLARESV